jgi:hypothetical protein
MAAGWTATVVTIVPIARHEFGGSSSAGLEFAPIGLTNMLNSGGAVCEVHVERVGPSSSTFETLGGWQHRGRDQRGCVPRTQA